MEQIIDYLNRLFIMEAEVVNASTTPSLEEYNKKLSDFLRAIPPELQETFGLFPKDAPESEDFYEMFRGAPPSPARVLFRIDYFGTDSEGNNIYAAYISGNNDFTIDQYANALILGEKNGVVKLLDKYLFSSTSPRGKRWMRELSGKKKIIPNSPLKTLRLTPPSNVIDDLVEYDAKVSLT